MDAEQLKLLAVRLRERLSSDGVAVSHGQALDLVAALPGLRRWPEVLAFPERVAARGFDLDAMDRLARRVRTRLGQRLAGRAERWINGDDLMDSLMPWQLTDPPDANRRERLIIASGDSAAGSLRASRIADRVERFAETLVWGPVPLDADDPATLRARRLAAADARPDTCDQPLAWQRLVPPGESPGLTEWTAHPTLLADHARIELWVDPDANGQLQLLHLLDWLGRQPAMVGRLHMAHVESRVGEVRPYEHRSRPPRLAPVGASQSALATLAWNAFRQPTPQAWRALLDQDLEALPRLRRTVRTMLAELPAAGSGLRASERRLLALVAEDDATPRQVMTRMARQDDPGVFGYWETGRLLNALGRGACPAITGIDDGPFDMPMLEDAARHQAYLSSRLGLSPFGRALLRGEADLYEHAPRSFWWGGTLVTREDPWRWNERDEQLSRGSQ